MVAAAIVGSTVVSAGTSLLGAGNASNAANAAGQAQVDAASKSADAQLQAAQLSIAEQQREYDLARSDFAPYRNIGTASLSELAALYGIGQNGLLPLTSANSNGTGVPISSQRSGHTTAEVSQAEIDAAVKAAGNLKQGQIATVSLPSGVYEVGLDPNAQGTSPNVQRFLPGYGPSGAGGATSPSVADAYARFQTSPGYQFRLDQGVKAVNNSLAARGLVNSGSEQKAINDYAQGQASSEFTNYANRLAQLAGFGSAATSGTTAAGTSAANAISNANIAAGQGAANAYTAAGTAQANALLGSASAYNQGLSGIGSSINSGTSNYLLLNALKAA